MPRQEIQVRALEPDNAKDMLVSLVLQAMRTARTEPSAFPQGLRVEVPVAYTDALAWLRAQQADTRIYWAGREHRVQIAGLGAADVISAHNGNIESVFAELQRDMASAHPNLRYYGGMAFDPSRKTSEEWLPFGSYRFTLPQFQLENHGTHSYLVCNVLLRTRGDWDRVSGAVLEGLDAIVFPEDTKPGILAPPVTRTDIPDPNGWTACVQEALKAIAEEYVRKVVLARRSVFMFDIPPDPLALLTRIVARTAATYQFYFQPEAGTAFLGATPEQLYNRHGRHVETEALAGTRPRGATSAEDATLAREFLSSGKDRREHGFVVQAIRETLDGLCRSVYTNPEVSVLKLPRCQHLMCPIEGILQADVSDALIMKALHPSPAVGGTPTAKALEYIREHEPFDRGWYAGPVGWVGPESGQFAVAIRSGLVHGNILSLYSGAGIVDGSSPDAEWDEIDTKLSNALSALTGHDD